MCVACALFPLHLMETLTVTDDNVVDDVDAIMSKAQSAKKKILRKNTHQNALEHIHFFSFHDNLN